MASTESLPVLNKVLQLVAFPSVPFGQTIMALLMFNVLSCFAWDALMMFLFGRDVLMATIRVCSEIYFVVLIRCLLLGHQC